MGSCRSDVAAQIREAITMKEVAEQYGFTPDRGGYIQCPFHPGDQHASLKIYPGTGGWHCFGCGRGGSVIDFVMLLFGITFRQALVRLNADFGLSLTRKTSSPRELSELVKARRREAERKAAVARAYPAVAAEYRDCYEITKYFPPILRPDGEIWFHPFYVEAVQSMPRLEWWLNEHMGR